MQESQRCRVVKHVCETISESSVSGVQQVESQMLHGAGVLAKKEAVFMTSVHRDLPEHTELMLIKISNRTSMIY
jgi:hypothetical protein